MEEFKQAQSEAYALTSIAISLKRIADKLELSQKQPIMMTAEEALKYHQAKRKYTETPVPRQFDVAPSIFNQS